MTKATTTDRVQSRADARARGLPRYLITAVLIRLADEGARVGLLLLALERTLLRYSSRRLLRHRPLGY
jgi:hypothetical protein